MPSQHTLLFVMLFCIVLISSMVRETEAKSYKILNIGWFTNGGTTLASASAITPSILVPVALNHFNQRSDAVLPLSSLIPESCNATLEMVGRIKDDQGSPSAAMKEFILNYKQADIVLGPVTSRTTVPVAVGAVAMGLPQVSFAASADELSDKSDFPEFFRIGSSDAQTAQAAAALFEQFKYKKVGVIYMNNVFGLAMKTAMLTECRKRGIQVQSGEYDVEASGEALDSQLTDVIESMKQLRLNVIVYAAIKMDVIRSLGNVTKKLDWWEGKLFVSHITIDDTGGLTQEQVEEAYLFLNGSLRITANVDARVPGAQRLLEVWHTLNASEVNPMMPERLQLPPYFFTLGHEKVAGRAWAWAYDSVIAIGLALCGNSNKFSQNLAKIDFNGTSGHVKFLQNSFDRDPDTFFYTLTNILIDPEKTAVSQKTVGTLSGPSGWRLSNYIVYNNGGYTPPNDIDPPPNEVESIPFGAQVLGYIEVSVALLCSLAALIYLFLHRRERILVESQPAFMAFVLVGCGLIACSIIALTIESDGGCMGFPWLFSTGIILAMTSIATKSARIAIYWRHRGKISNWKKLLGTRIIPFGMFVLVLINLVIMLSWQLIAPWRLSMVIIDKDFIGNPLRSSLVCDAGPDSSQSTVFIGLLIAYMCVIAILTGWVSCRVRNAPRRYHEAKMTALAGICIFQILLMAVPGAYAVWMLPLPRFLVLSSTCFLQCMIVLCTMFAPKVFKVRFLGSMAAKSAAKKMQPEGKSGRGGARKNVGFISTASPKQTTVKFVEGAEEHEENGSQEAIPQKSTSDGPPRPMATNGSHDVNSRRTDSSTNEDHSSSMNQLLQNTADPNSNNNSNRAVADWKLMILGIKSEAEDDEDDLYEDSTPDSQQSDIAASRTKTQKHALAQV